MNDPQSTEVAAAFDAAVGEAVRECHRIGYRPSYFQQMLSEFGAVVTAQKLINSATVSDGFTTLWEKGRLDLTVEAIALRPEFRDLFTAPELREAERRLKAYGVTRFTGRELA